MDLPNARVNTAGAYVCINGLFVFTIGTRPHNGCIPVVRLGGHREGNETGWQCAAREVREESGLDIKPLVPAKTFLADGDSIDNELGEIQWGHPAGECDPLLIAAYPREGGTLLSLMYLAEAAGFPKPCSEVKGLLLLKAEEVHWLCYARITLEQYVRSGGQALLDDQFDQSMILEPFAQLRLLSRMLRQVPNLHFLTAVSQP